MTNNKSTAERNYAAIREHIMNDTPITEDQQRLLKERFWPIIELCRKFGPKQRQILRAYKNILKAKSDDNLPADWYLLNEIKGVQKSFGSLIVAEKEIKRHFVESELLWDLKNYKALLKLAFKSEDMNTIKVIGALRIKTMSEYIKASGIDQEDPDLPDFAKLEKHTYTIEIDNTMTTIVKGLIKQNKSIDLTKVFGDEILELDFEPVIKEVGNG